MSLLPFWAQWGSSLSDLDPVRSSPPDPAARSPTPAPLLFTATPNCPLLVEAYDADGAAAHRLAWSDLVGNCLEPNVFAEPSFVLTAAQHLASTQRPVFVMVWALEASGGRELLAVCPLTRSRNPIDRTTTVWFHDLSTLGAPLLHRNYAGVALQALLAWVARRSAASGALLFHALPAGGGTARALADVAAMSGRRVRWLDLRLRAGLRSGSGKDAAGLSAVPARRAKELRRQRRRLAEHGRLHYSSVRDGEDLRHAVEQFLLLEARGWKGARGTALLMDASRAAFARAMTRLLGREGKCRVDSLLLDGAPIASGIILSSGRQDFFWKMAYDEKFSSLSPGVQFVLDLTEAQRRDLGVELTDSCADPDHPMIDRLWPDRLSIVDAMVAITPGSSARFKAEVAVQKGGRRVKALAKSILAPVASRRRRALYHPGGR